MVVFLFSDIGVPFLVYEKSLRFALRYETNPADYVDSPLFAFIYDVASFAFVGDVWSICPRR